MIRFSALMFMVMTACGSTATDERPIDTSTNTDTGPKEVQSEPSVCLEACSTAADCAGNVDLFDEDNYSCEAGGCEYLGCNSNQECIDFYGATSWVCRDFPGQETKWCNLTCSEPADCVPFASGDLFDASHYTCDAGMCNWTGCVSNAECAAQYGGTFVCHYVDGMGTCVNGCGNATDCGDGGAANDADNYRCETGACVYEGCNDTAECKSSFGAGAICR